MYKLRSSSLLSDVPGQKEDGNREPKDSYLGNGEDDRDALVAVDWEVFVGRNADWEFFSGRNADHCKGMFCNGYVVRLGCLLRAVSDQVRLRSLLDRG